MSIQRLGVGPRMSQAVVHGNMVYLSGQVGEGDTMADQCRDCLAKVDHWLEQAGSDKSHILSVTVWLSSMDDFADMNAVYDAWVDPANPPARAAGEARLARAQLLVEFMVVAVKP